MTNSLNNVNNVFVITRASRQHDDSFDKNLNGVYVSIEAARAELERISKGYNSDEEHVQDWRAKCPIGSVDALSVELLVGDWYECKVFYKIEKEELKG